MIKGEYDYLKALAEINECAEHGTPLLVATHPTDALWVLRCGEGHYPDTIRHIPSYLEEYKQGTLAEGPIADNIKRREKRKARTDKQANHYPALGYLPKVDLATGEMLLPEVTQALVVYARQYGLDPYRGHVMIMYGKPYIGLDGYLYHANRSGKPYKLYSRPLTTPERADYLVEEGTHAWVAYVKTGDGEGLFSGLGLVTRAELTAKSTKHPEQLRSPVVAAHPWQLAQKRAEWQALRRAFPIGETEEVKSEAGD